MDVRNYVERNIKNRIPLVMEAWEVSKNIVSFGLRVHAFHEYLQAELKNEKRFYINDVLPFGMKVSNMTKEKRREEDFPSPSRIKQLKSYWIEKIKNLRDIVQTCSEVITKREELFKRITEIDLTGSIGEVQDPKLIFNSFL
jgi:hypothetical protein